MRHYTADEIIELLEVADPQRTVTARKIIRHADMKYTTLEKLKEKMNAQITAKSNIRLDQGIFAGPHVKRICTVGRIRQWLKDSALIGASGILVTVLVITLANSHSSYPTNSPIRQTITPSFHFEGETYGPF